MNICLESDHVWIQNQDVKAQEAAKTFVNRILLSLLKVNAISFIKTIQTFPKMFNLTYMMRLYWQPWPYPFLWSTTETDLHDSQSCYVMSPKPQFAVCSFITTMNLNENPWHFTSLNIHTDNQLPMIWLLFRDQSVDEQICPQDSSVWSQDNYVACPESKVMRHFLITLWVFPGWI